MTLSISELIDSLNKAYRLVKPRRDDLDKFKTQLSLLLSRIDPKESEENVKIHLADFLKNTFFHPEHLVATKGRTDLVVHTGKEAKSAAGILFEVKKPTNKGDMITKTNLNAKSMHELILYFLRERFNAKNTSLTNLVITNIYEWYIFDAQIFEKIFTQDIKLQKAFKEWESGQKVSSTTDLFYKEIAKPFLDEYTDEITFTHFDLRDFEQYLTNESEQNDKKLIPLFKFFTPVHLLKLSFTNDSNSLDKGFYSELLHIIGLEEVKDGGKKIIRRLPEGKRHPASLIENTINMLEVDDVLLRLNHVKSYGADRNEQLFTIALELSITWVNRILFLKLLEAQLIRYHNSNKAYRFLNIQTIRDYDELYKLFFQVLAKEPKDRSELIKKKYSHIPYLNSSLFDRSDVEEKTIRVNMLDDNLDMELYPFSVLKKSVNKKDLPVMNSLHYFFDFLDAYDFASVGKEEIQEQNKTIINAAVLGLVFEKINGYKDGSIYTPGAVTTFLCRETIRRAVVKKFNDQYNWTCANLEDVGNYLSDRRTVQDIIAFNAVIDSVTIVDPAVGSGHFLVSSLNELIAIKAELGILAEKGKRLSDIDVSIANDELVVTYRNEEQSFFEYLVHTGTNGSFSISPNVQRIQQTLFNEKRRIIEQCLFGVDINPNSVKICQLRLWIELLKHAYYKPESQYAELETLPNIDINIKHGNSLLSKYSLTEDLSEVFRKHQFGIKDYQLAVAAYKDAPGKEAKAELQDFIKKIKKEFRDTVSRRDPKRKRLAELRGQLSLAQNNFDLFGQKKSQQEMELEVRRLSLQIEKSEQEITEIESNAIYRNAFEWRFEFPEVLNERGDFEGFDVLIGNPPYIQLQKMGADADALQKQGYKTFARTGDIYCLFYEQAIRLLKPGYYFGFITSNKWMRANYGVATRTFFLDETNPLLLVDFSGYQVFESATVDTNMLITQKAHYSGTTQSCLLDRSLSSLEKMSGFVEQTSRQALNFSRESSWVILSEIENSIKTKIEAIGKPLKDWDVQINYGVKTGFNEAFIIDGKKRKELIDADPKSVEIIRPILRGRDIKRYKYNFADLWLIATFPSQRIDIEKYPAVKQHLLSFGYDRLKQTGEPEARKKTNNEWFETQDSISYWDDFSKQKVVWGEISDTSNFALDNNDNYSVNNKCYLMTGLQLEYLVCFLNSYLAEYLFSKIATTTGVGTLQWSKFTIEQLFVPVIPIEKQKEYKCIATQIIQSHRDDEVVTATENKFNEMIYNEFGLSREEIEFIELQ